MSAKVSIFLAAMFSSIIAGDALASPREDCETAISALGYPLTGYAFEKSGFFSMEKHRIGGVTCYIDINDKIDSLYIGEELLAEDGYFGREALRERDRIREQAKGEINAARAARDAKIDETRSFFNTFEAAVEDRTESELAAVKEASDPFRTGTAVNSAEVAQDPVREMPSGTQDELAPDQEPVAEAEPVVVDPDTPGKSGAVKPEREEGNSSQNPERRYVTADRLMRRTCPSSNCGSIGALMYRDGVDVLEEENGWVRFSEPGPAVCEDGISYLIETGDARCIQENGIINGRFALWVNGDYLSAELPEDPADSASADEEIVKYSDDFRHHRRAFAQAAADLIDDGRCTRGDFKEFGNGWVKSSGEQQNQPIYFMYCGGFTQGDKVELNVETGHIVR